MYKSSSRPTAVASAGSDTRPFPRRPRTAAARARSAIGEELARLEASRQSRAAEGAVEGASAAPLGNDLPDDEDDDSSQSSTDAESTGSEAVTDEGSGTRLQV